MSHSALASLTAQYTDSENEGDASPDSQNSTASQVIIPKQPTPQPATPVKQDTEPAKKSKKRKRAKKVRRLVSYQDDTLISDEEEDRAHESSKEDESSSDSDNSAEDNEHSENGKEKVEATGDGAAAMQVDGDDSSNYNNSDERSAESYEKDPKYAKYKFQLPPEPKGNPPPELVAKITKMYTKMRQTNMDMNRVIQDRKEFRNPSIYEKLISFCDINEFGTNYPPEIYDPLQWGEESYYESLSAVQKTELVKLQKDRKEMDKVEQVTALARKVEEEAKKRKSKWDQPAAKQTLPALTTTVTGTKGTVISAFGSLPKKPAV
ncbi:SAP30-binding protein [Drosophila sulfurigaster albostrigata]|uniref:SAP30-binding protein n=1 Tax=Drosophila sulfurigaster albostrigata TaxID=89887 RepID=UPI002D21DF47|nr:SAP30-binding protein [Drosophila sulfurigaster albostrigata]